MKTIKLLFIYVLIQCLTHQSVFSQTSILRFQANPNAGTLNQVNEDLVMVDGLTTIDLSSSSLTCSSSVNGNTQTYQIAIEDDYDENGTMDQITFDLVIKAYTGSIYTYSDVANSSSMTSLGSASTISIVNNIWGINNDGDIDASESIVVTIENLSVTTLPSKYELKFSGFTNMMLLETNGGNTHKLIKGQGNNLPSYSFSNNNNPDYSLSSEEVLTITGAGSAISGREFGMSSINFSITVDDTDLGGFNDLSDYSLFSNADNFGEAYPDQTRVVNHSEFSWERIPRWLAVRNTEPLTNEEVTDLTSHYQVVMLEKANNQGLTYVEDGMVSLATRLKAKNPNITTLFYWNTWINYFGYEANIEYDLNANDWSDLDANGVPILFKDLYYTYDFTQQGLRDWWVDIAIKAMENDVLDGVFVDKVTNAAFKDIFDVNGDPVNYYVRMLSDLYDAMPEGKMVIGNTLRTERVNSNRAIMEVMDGSYMERWDFPGTAENEDEAIAISIQAMREALSKGKIIHFQTSPHHSTDLEEPSDYAGKVQYAKDHVDFPLAVFLIIVEENAYFSYQSSVNARANVEDVWNTSFIDEFHYRLGEPLGPPTKDGYIYERSFENVDVWVNLSTREAILDWHDTTIVNTDTTILEGNVTTEPDVQTLVTNNAFAGLDTEASVGVFSANANYHQLRGTAVILDNLAGTITFDLLTSSGTVDGVPTFNFRKLGGNSASVTITIGDLTPQTFTLQSDGVSGSNSFVAHDLEFAESVTFSTTPTLVTFEITDLDQGSSTGVTNSRLYNVSIDKTVSLSTENFEAGEFKLHPNPITNTLNITLKNDKNLDIEIFDLFGKHMLSKKLVNGTNKIDLSYLSKGVYFVKASNQYEFKVVKIIKK